MGHVSDGRINVAHGEISRHYHTQLQQHPAVAAEVLPFGCARGSSAEVSTARPAGARVHCHHVGRSGHVEGERGAAPQPR